MNPDSEETAELIEELNVEERDEDEGFCDVSEDHTIADPEDVLSPPSSTLTLGSSTVVTSSDTAVLGSTSPSLVPDPTPAPSSPGPSGTAVPPFPSETSVSPLSSEPGMLVRMMMTMKRLLLTTKMFRDTNMLTSWPNIWWSSGVTQPLA
ncbi:histone-lysine N-methyltransferase SETD1B-like [Carassius auratus]|uniref:Histone-lysine N-methyltransferase SETD1B-like n=1 Tax=Carassius auratus TaxID=7957 RepID=A0A6P6PGE7_CARAU|nr:histone-lysine N-methyltransferase SETD1B-like [Carassius auratus]